MAFHEVRLPARLAFGSTGGVERRTEITTLASGFERRSTPWADGRRRYLIGAGLRSLDDMAALTEFFEARRGRLHGFRLRDFADFRSGAPGAAVTPLDQAIGTGDGERRTFQLCKAYGDHRRLIAKPVEGSVRVTLATAPPQGAAVTAGFAFDVPVRFDADRMEVTLESFGAGRMVAMPLIEVRV